MPLKVIIVLHSINTLSRLQVKSLTCDKLSHCLFDFDCPTLEMYEKEKYNYQEFILDDLLSS